MLNLLQKIMDKVEATEHLYSYFAKQKCVESVHLICKQDFPSSFQFQYTDSLSVQQVIDNLKLKSSAGYNNISAKLLRHAGDTVAYPFSIIINQMLRIGEFTNRLKLAKVIHLYTKMTINHSETIAPYLCCRPCPRCLINWGEYLNFNGLLFESQYGFRKQHSTELAALELTDRI